MNIPVIIPWDYDNNLGRACNLAMSRVEDWAILLDHDVLMLHPEWYRTLCNAAKKIGHASGWITGVTSATGTRSPCQIDHAAPRTHNIADHFRYAHSIYQDRKDETLRYKAGTVFSGFLILTHREAWETVGGFVEGPGVPVDSQYHYSLINYKYQAHVLRGLYMYHIHTYKKVWNF